LLTCINGHDSPDGSKFCRACGVPLTPDATGENPTVAAPPPPYPMPPAPVAQAGSQYQPVDGIVAALVLGLLLLLVMFIAALVGAGTANSGGNFGSYALVAGNGAVPWGIAILLVAGAIAVRLRSLRR
jgi:hypothetical protein